MANIRIDLNHVPMDGETVAFRAPCDASGIKGLIIYYPDLNSQLTSAEYTLNDANGGDIGVVDNIFSAGAIVKVILDTDTNNAFVQNSDTNTYLEGKFDAIASTFDEAMGIVSALLDGKSDISHKHDEDYDVKGASEGALNTAKSYTDTQITDLILNNIITNSEIDEICAIPMASLIGGVY